MGRYDIFSSFPPTPTLPHKGGGSNKAPSPLVGEGWGGGGIVPNSTVPSMSSPPHPNPLPCERRRKSTLSWRAVTLCLYCTEDSVVAARLPRLPVNSVTKLTCSATDGTSRIPTKVSP